mgnify:FL=1
MQVLSESDILLIDTSLECGEPFALIMLPGEQQPFIWTAGKNPGKDMHIHIAPWLAEEGSVIHNLAPGPQTSVMTMCQTSTPASHYLAAVKDISERCRTRNGKSVYSRVICGTTDEAIGWGQRADEFFSRFPDTFRFIYFTPATLGWMGATPEILLNFDKRSGRFSTMSLAGTRPSSAAGSWDDKNVEENNFVTEYIVAQLQDIAEEIKVSPANGLRYGSVVHLLHTRSGKADKESIPALIKAINPTPALCGIPKADAIKDISELELHDRNCYGGYIAVDTPDRFIAFVNLRCVQFSGSRFCAYAGGGITGASIPEDELAETNAKLSRLLPVLTSGHNQESLSINNPII